MKKITITLLLLSLAGMALYAEGSQEETTWEPGMGYINQNFNAESITLTGKIDLTDVNLPKLTVGENTYELMVPYRLDYDINIKNGDEITISGFEVPAKRRTADSELTNLMVTGATFDGTDYDLNMMSDGPMGYGRRADMMNNAYGHKGRSGRFNKGGFQNNSRGWGSQPDRMMNTPYSRPFSRR